MAGRYNTNPFDEDEVNPFALRYTKHMGVMVAINNSVFNVSGFCSTGRAAGQSNYGGGAFYTTNPGRVPPAVNSRLSPLPPEPADFNYDRGTTIDIPLDSSKDLKKEEKELQAKEAELNKRGQVIEGILVRGLAAYVMR